MCHDIPDWNYFKPECLCPAFGPEVGAHEHCHGQVGWSCHGMDSWEWERPGCGCPASPDEVMQRLDCIAGEVLSPDILFN